MKKLVFLLIGLLTATYLMAGVVTEEEALQKAERFLKGKKVLARAKASRARGKQSDAGADFGKAFYVFNVENKGGFVIVSGDDRTEEILGYAESGEMDLDNLPSNVKAWLEGYQQQIKALGNSELTNVSKKSRAAIPYLIKTRWGQESPYNQQCPEVEVDGSSLNCPTGCVATALAQVLYYNKSPQNEISGLDGYTTRTLGLNVDALPSTTFNWQKMSLSYTSDELYEAQEVSKLMRYCGQWVKMDYTSAQSGAHFHNLEEWGYTKETVKSLRDYQTEEEWEDLIYGELSAGRPIIYSGYSAQGVGHEFICDGYDGNGLFHINWGWGGRYDGFFLLTALEPEFDNFSFSQYAVINFQPSDGVIPPNLEGTEFTAMTKEGVEMNFMITYDDGTNRNCEVSRHRNDGTKDRCIEKNHEGSISIPSEVNYDGHTYQVTGIGPNAFNNCSLTAISIPVSVNLIFHDAFSGCTNLNSITIDSGNTTYYDGGVNAIIEKNTERLIVGTSNTLIPESVKEIGDEAFAGCKIKFLVIPKGVKYIGSRAFSECKNLSSISVHPENSIYDSRNGCNAIIETATNKLLFGTSNTIIPSDVTWIGWYAFCELPNLTITIPAAVKRIDNYAFQNCRYGDFTVCYEDLSSVSIGSYAFSGASWCDMILRVPNNTKAAYLAADGWNKFKPENVVEVYTGEEFTVPLENGVEMWFTITEDDENNKTAKVGRRNGNYPSSAVTVLNDDRIVIIPSKVTYKGTEYTVNTIGAYAFYEIGSSNFNSSAQLQIEIPATITNIEGYAFTDCNNLSIIAESEIPAKAEECSFSTGYKLRVPAGSKDSYLAAKGWNKFNAENVIDGYVDVEFTAMLEDNVEMWFTITSDDANNKTAKVGKLEPQFGEGAIEQSIDSKIIAIPQTIEYKNTTYTVNEIGNFSFFLAQQEQIKLPSTITSIGDNAFTGIENLTITLSPNIAYIGSEAFHCSNLDMTVINEIPATINIHAFWNPGVIGIQSSNYILRVPKGSKQAYLSTWGWNAFPEDNVIEYVSGDVNGDGEVDIADAVCIVNHIVGKATPVFVEAAADVNNDGDIDIADAVRVVNLIVGKINALARQMLISLPEPE